MNIKSETSETNFNPPEVPSEAQLALHALGDITSTDKEAGGGMYAPDADIETDVIRDPDFEDAMASFLAATGKLVVEESAPDGQPTLVFYDRQ